MKLVGNELLSLLCAPFSMFSILWKLKKNRITFFFFLSFLGSIPSISSLVGISLLFLGVLGAMSIDVVLFGDWRESDLLFLGDLGDFERDDLVDFVSSSLSFPSRFFFFDFLSFFLSELGKVNFSYQMEMNLWKGVAQIDFGFHPALSSFSFSLDSKDQLQNTMWLRVKQNRLTWLSSNFLLLSIFGFEGANFGCNSTGLNKFKSLLESALVCI